ncbi:hypothetical protein [Bosea sp. TAF32]|uniref:hypothetical protein n=1 Tax=Bosea sp. TAF32 TaxID=3237482 RepID=UPI003F8F53F9
MSFISHFADGAATGRDPLAVVRNTASSHSFSPRGTVRCVGQPLFRSQTARDLGCLLDVDPSVVSWSCLPLVLEHEGQRHVPDFSVTRANGTTLADVGEDGAIHLPDWAAGAARKAGHQYEYRRVTELREGFRFENAHDLLRYARFRAPLGDRIRLLTLIDDQGPLPLAHCMQAVRCGSDAIAVIASLVLRRFLDIDLDEARIGPDTRVSRFRG